MKKLLAITLIFLSTSSTIFAQASRHGLRDGNRQYNKEHYDKAELAYRRALERDTTDARGQYNLGSALYRQKKYDDAARHYEQVLSTPKINDKKRANAYHNLGNSMLKDALAGNQDGFMQKLQQALSAYQEALKLNPKNEDTRYNLALTQRLLRQAQQQQQQSSGGGEKDKQQDNNQQNSSGDQNQQNQSKQQDSQQQNGIHDGKQKEQQNKNQDVKKRDAERMLEAMKNNERQTLREINRNDEKSRSSKREKDW